MLDKMLIVSYFTPDRKPLRDGKPAQVLGRTWADVKDIAKSLRRPLPPMIGRWYSDARKGDYLEFGWKGANIIIRADCDNL